VKVGSLLQQQQPLKINPDINTDATRNKKDAALEQSAKDLEAVFLSFVLKSLEKTISLDPEKNTANMANMLFSSVLSKEIADKGGIGLADFIYKALQEKGVNPLQHIKKDYHYQYFNVINKLRSSDE